MKNTIIIVLFVLNAFLLFVVINMRKVMLGHIMEWLHRSKDRQENYKERCLKYGKEYVDRYVHVGLLKYKRYNEIYKGKG